MQIFIDTRFESWSCILLSFGWIRSPLYILPLLHYFQPGCPSWSKGGDLRSSVFALVGSNPTSGNFFTFFQFRFHALSIHPKFFLFLE